MSQQSTIYKDGNHKWTKLEEKTPELENYQIGRQSSLTTYNCSYAVLVLGKTGCGKSSLIKTMTGNNSVEIGVSSKSCTQNCGYYVADNILWIDTKGGLDTNENSGVTLKNIKKECYNNGIDKLKFIWCIDGSNRTDAEFIAEAKSIQSYDQNVWKSCLVVEKQGIPSHTSEAALTAVKEVSNGEYNYINQTGFTCINWVKYTKLFDQNNMKLDNIIEDYHDYKQQDQLKLQQLQTTRRAALQKQSSKRYKRGYFDENEVQRMILDELNQLGSVDIKYDINKCIDCGIIGDPSFVTQLCHYSFEKYHSGMKYKYHSSCNMVHTGSYRKCIVIKPINNNNITVDNYKYNEENYYYNNSNNNNGETTTTTMWFGVGFMTRLFDLINNNIINYKIIGNIYAYAAAAQNYEKIEVYQWSCCGKSGRDANGCKWECCLNTIENEGCEWKCSDCNNDWYFSEGCNEKCVDCNQPKGHKCTKH